MPRSTCPVPPGQLFAARTRKCDSLEPTCHLSVRWQPIQLFTVFTISIIALFKLGRSRALRCQFLPLLKRSIKGHPAIRLRRWVLPRCSGRRGSDPSPRKCSGLKTTMTHSERQMGIPTRRLGSGRDDGPTLSSIDRRSIPFFQLRRSIISGVPDRRYVHQSSKLYDGGL